MPQRQRWERQIFRELLRNVRQRVEIPIALRGEENPEDCFLGNLDNRHILSSMTLHIRTNFWKIHEMLQQSDRVLRDVSTPYMKSNMHHASEYGRNQGLYGVLHNQDFHSIRSWCYKQRILYEDPYFRLEDKYEWKRPWEITKDPQLYVSGTSRNDVVQGKLGDCWILAAISDLAMQPDLVAKVIPSDQGFTYQYAGVFHFRLYQFGNWFDVVVDDRLPTLNGELVYLQTGSNNEYWAPLLEKAYCKILGSSYMSADAGNLCEALEDFTGGVVEQYSLKQPPDNLQNILLKSDRRRSLMGCFIDADPNTDEARTPEGLLAGHSYSITRVKNVNIRGNKNVVLLRLRDPWGESEWNGTWSDTSPEWRSVTDKTKQELGLTYDNVGEFWMSYSDFLTHFQWLDMCHLSPDAYMDGKLSTNRSQNWQLEVTKGSWVKGLTAGGVKIIHQNPQVRVTLNEADDDNHNGLCSVLIALMQRPKGADRLVYNDIGFRIYQLDDPYQYQFQTALDRNFFRTHKSVVQTTTKAVREVSARYNLEPGVYCIIPFTYESDKEGDFMLRVFFEIKDSQRKCPQPTVKYNIDQQGKMSDKKVEGTFDQITDGGMEDKWKEMKEILDFAMNNDVPASSSDENGIHILQNIALYFINTFLGTRAANVLHTVSSRGFPTDVCRSIITLIGVDHSGTLSYKEFKVLWTEIQKWTSIYHDYSHKTKAFLNSFELKEALHSAGFRLNDQILGGLVDRYADRDGRVFFDGFLQCALKLKTITESFKSKHKNDPKKAEFTLEEYIETTLYS